MRYFSLALPAVLVLAACDGGTQGADVSAEEARAEGNIVGNSSSSKPNTAKPEPEVTAGTDTKQQGR